MLTDEEATRRLSLTLLGEPLVTVPCPACSSKGTDVELRKDVWRILSCHDCGTFYVNPRPPESSLLELYRKFPDLANGREGLRTLDPDEGGREARYRLERLKQVCPSGRLLDVGCGRGDFIRMAAGPFDPMGIDVVPRLAGPVDHSAFRCGRIQDAHLESDHFDVVTIAEVLEHLFRPDQTLKEIWRILKPGGVLLVQTGDVTTFLPRLNFLRWTYVQPPIHLNYFSRKGLVRLLESCEFRIERSWSFGRATKRAPWVGRLRTRETFRPFLDLAARASLIGQLHAARRAS